MPCAVSISHYSSHNGDGSTVARRIQGGISLLKRVTGKMPKKVEPINARFAFFQKQRKKLSLLLLFILAFWFLGLPAASAEAATATPSTRLILYFGFQTPNNFYLFPVTTAIPYTSTPAAKALELLIQGPPAGGPLWSSIPPATKVRNLEIKDGTAYVDFSREITQANVGSSGEAILLQSIVTTLGQFPSVKRVKILVEGQPVATLAGHVDTSGFLEPQSGLVYRGFADLRGHWSEGEVLAFSLRGILAGYPDGTFQPDQKISRGEFIKLLLSALDLSKGEVPPAATSSFTDVGKTSWLYPYVERAVTLGILRPADYGQEFRPNEAVTRREMATLMVRACGWEDEARQRRGTVLPFADIQGEPDWAKGYLAVMAERGYFRGYPDRTLRPEGKATRAEAVALLGRVLDLGSGSIYLTEPRRQGNLKDRFLVLGTASVFEAHLNFRLRTKEGDLLLEDFLVASEGAPGWGVFGGLFRLPAGGEISSEGRVQVFYRSARDGQEMNVVEIPVLFAQ